MMDAITIDQFGDYFNALHGHDPYPWQQRLAQRAVENDWPGAIDLPTGSGKTACIDVAIFALACQASQMDDEQSKPIMAPRRIFFCVNRRVIVDEAHQRARRIAESIWNAERNDDGSILARVAAALRVAAHCDSKQQNPPLDVLELRGGIYRDNRWARSVTQPTVVCTTIDQLGSRLLFRGYGVSEGAAPIQAALIAYDSLILLDEAHISRPFLQTLEAVSGYLDPRKWAKVDVGVQATTVVPMTATPTEEMIKRGVIELEDDDRDPKYPLLQRLTAAKPTELREVKDIARDAVTAAIEFIGDNQGDAPTAVGIIVNRVVTARAIHEALLTWQAEPNDKKRKVSSDATIELVIGSMRPIDRDEQAERLRAIVGPDRPKPTSTQTSFVVATQCLEVGADYDFDVLITECASIDALRQRFGRLNRAGRPIDARGVILINKKDAKPDDKLDDEKPHDPIYGNGLTRTWNWLSACAVDRVVDFGIKAMGELLDEHGDDGKPPAQLLAPSASAASPVMLPAYIDLWCQTSPRPVPDPDVSLFIHGQQSAEPDVQVCWRADLSVNDVASRREQWCDTVALLPPTAAECMRVPVSRLRRWLTQQQIDDASDHGDVLGVADEDETNQRDQRSRLDQPGVSGVLWRGRTQSELLRSPKDLRPGDTLVLPADVHGSRTLGHFIDHNSHHHASSTVDSDQTSSVADVAERAFLAARDRAALRLHSSMRLRFPINHEAFDELFKAASDHETPRTRDQWLLQLQACLESLDADDPRHALLEPFVSDAWRIDPYPDGQGVILTTRKRLGCTDLFMPTLDDGEDDASRTTRNSPVLLEVHTSHVTETLVATVRSLPLNGRGEPLRIAALLHDLGKADNRFQAMLRRSSRSDAYLAWGGHAALWAKSPGKSTTYAHYTQDCRRAGLPERFRHEMLSVQLAERSDRLPSDEATRDLVLHLIAAHHGRARPFAPVVIDNELPGVEVADITLTHEQRVTLPAPHQLDSGIADRFWSLTRRFGWWGLAYLEAVLRLADQQASAAEDEDQYDDIETREPVEVGA